MKISNLGTGIFLDLRGPKFGHGLGPGQSDDFGYGHEHVEKSGTRRNVGHACLPNSNLY